MIKLGDIVFFKKAKKSLRKGINEIAFKGHGFGMFMGHAPIFAQEPPQEHLTRMMGSCGYMSFDDVEAFLGKEVLDDVIKKFEAKYFPVESITPETKTETEEKPSSLVGLDGKPL